MEIWGWDIPLSWTLMAGCVLLVYIYGKWRNRILRDAGIPGPEPYIYIGNLPLIVMEGFDMDNKLGKKYGKVFGAYLGGFPMINVFDPDIIREVMIKNFQNFPDRLVMDLDDSPVDTMIFFNKGATWRRLRNIMSPTFSGGKLRLMCDQINHCASVLTEHFIEAAKKGEPIPIKENFGAFTMDVIASTAFGIDVDSQSDNSNEFLVKAKQVFGSSPFRNPMFLIALIFPGAVPFLKMLGVGQFPKDSTKFFVKVLKEMIEQRKQDAKTGQKRVDFLQLLLDAEEAGTQEGDVSNSNHSQADTEKPNKKMTTEEVLGQAFLFFIAGYETTANTLHFASFSLATHPDVQDKLFAEIDSVLGDADPSYDNIGDLVYLDHVISETLRLYPAVPGISRMVKETVIIKGYTFPKGCGVNVPNVVIQRDPEFFPEPETFNPGRWEKKGDMEHMAYLPFGQGPRNCLGMRLALVEMKIAMAQVLKKVKFVPAPDTPQGVLKDFATSSTLAPKKPIKLLVELRRPRLSQVGQSQSV